MSTLLNMQVGTFSLPSLKFFEPNKKFTDYMSKHSDKIVYDVGAGVGHVTKILLDSGLKVIPIDIVDRDNSEVPVILANGTTFSYQHNSVVMICRPCHGHFCEATIKNAFNRKVSNIIYVGKASNVEDDLGSFYPKFKCVKAEVGEEDENIYEWNINP
jgi:hypothetical protein